MHRTYTNPPSSSTLLMGNAQRRANAGVDLFMLPPATEEDDDQVFCVVCDGECTCGSASQVAILMDSTPSAYSPRVSPPLASTSASTSKSTLKIKLPPGLLSKARTSSATIHNRSDQASSSNAKRLKRLNKPDVTTKKSKSSLKAPGKPVRPRPPLAKKSAALKKKRKNRAAVPWEGSDSDLSDLDTAMLDALGENDDCLPAPPNLPTFVSASSVGLSSALDSSDSDSDSSLTAGFDTDASMEAEEESFIIADALRHKDRTRVRGSGGETSANSPRATNWEIKPRMRSVGIEDEMDVDSGEETEADDDGEEDEPEEAEEDATTDADGWGAPRRPVATTWSDPEESEMDADIFFANLSSDNSSSSDEESVLGDDSTPAPTTTDPGFSPSMFLSFDNQPVWGADVLVNGLDSLPTFMDADLACFLQPNEESSASQVSETDEAALISGYEREDEDDGGDNMWESDEDLGATTDEDLVDELGLPTPKAMSLFKMPVAPVDLAAVAPLATVSPYVHRVSKISRDRPPAQPTDILAGRGAYNHDNDSDEHDHDGLVTRRARSSSWSISRGGVRFPRMGRFDGVSPTAPRQAVIDGNAPEVPSPFPRRARSLRRSETDRASQSPFRSVTRSRGASFSDMPLTNFNFTSPPIDESEAEGVAQFVLAPPIQLDDVLHSAFLGTDETDTEEPPASDMITPSSSVDMTRWDFLPVNTFRQANITGELLNTPSSLPTGILKQSPYPTLLWPTPVDAPVSPVRESAAGPSRRARSGSAASRARSVSRPPYMLDRELTPTPAGLGLAISPEEPDTPFGEGKSRQELRRERRAARKAATLPPPPIHTPKKRPIPHHAHHGNGKSRSTSSAQRFGSSPSAATPLGW